MYLEEAKKLQEEIIENRRTLHSFAELAFDLPKTLAFVTEKLEAMGIHPKKVGKAGLTFCLGKEGGKVILIRGDMDALPIPEESGLDFRAENGNCHACGHDFHTSMLLGAAKLLKAHEQELEGQVKFMFQPAEEKLAGSLDMIANGILENPKVDAAFGMHVTVAKDQAKAGEILYREGPLMLSGDALEITVLGEEAHGSVPYLGVDAIQIACRIALEVNGILPRTLPAGEAAVALVGKIQGGNAVNIVAKEAKMELCLRTENKESREKLIQAVKETAERIAETYGGKAIVDHPYGTPPMVNNVTLAKNFARYARDLVGEDHVHEVPREAGSEDFVYVAEQVPTAFFFLGMGSPEEGHVHPLHHAAVSFEEGKAYVGAALYAQIATRFLGEKEDL